MPTAAAIASAIRSPVRVIVAFLDKQPSTAPSLRRAVAVAGTPTQAGGEEIAARPAAGESAAYGQEGHESGQAAKRTWQSSNLPPPHSSAGRFLRHRRRHFVSPMRPL